MVEKTLGDVATYINGRAFKPQEWETSGRPIIRIQNLTNSTQECNRTTKQFEEKYRISDGDLLFAWSASLGAHIWHGEDGWLNQHIFKVIPNESIDKIYLYYYLLYVVDQLYAKTHGSGMVHITLKPFKSTRIMLPELNEQRRVVGKIESLFAKLDEAKEKAQAVVDSFETRKAAILHKAFTGELTAKWREEHGVGMDSWEKKSVGELCISLKYGTAKKSDASGNVVVLRMGNLQQGEIDWSDLAYSNDPDDIEKYKLNSYLAQIFDGLIQSQEMEKSAGKKKEKQNHFGSNLGSQIAFKLFGKGIDANAQATYEHLKTVANDEMVRDVQTKIMHDNAFDEFASYLSENGLLGGANIGNFISVEDEFYQNPHRAF